MDVYDEVDRRETDASMFHSVKLSTIFLVRKIISISKVELNILRCSIYFIKPLSYKSHAY